VYEIVTKSAGGIGLKAKPTDEYGHSLDEFLKLISKKTKLIFIANPNNPTGSVLSVEDIKDIIKLAYTEKLMVIADECFQENIYLDNFKFTSFRKVLNDLGEPFKNQVELLSMNSVSYGYLAESGFRGGYAEFHNFDPFIMEQLYKVKSIELCSNTIGQHAIALKLNPPSIGIDSDATVM